MLKRFSVKNYRGFRDELVWDLSQPGKYTFNEYAVKDGILKNGIIYGTNGSGKSNLSMAVMDITQHMTSRLQIMDYADNYIYGGAKDGEQVEFCYTFQFGDRELVYRYSKDKEGHLQSEELLVNGIRALAKNGNDVFFDTNYHITEQAKQELRDSVNPVSIINYTFSNLTLDERHYIPPLRRFISGITCYQTITMQQVMPVDFLAKQIEKMIIRGNLLDRYKSFLLEMSHQEVEFVPPQEGDEDLYCMIEGKPILWRKITSQGTKALTALFVQYAEILRGNHTFVILDEFDAFYHHELAYNVCKVLFSNETTQVFMTTHHTSLMTNDLLRPDCYFVIDGKTIKPIKELTHQELREAHNLEKMYRGKAFSR